MKRTTGVTIVLGALAAAGAMDIAAQDAAEVRRPTGRGPAVEAIMQMRDRLELTEAQLADLDAIRREEVQRRSAAWAEMAEMRSRLAAGQIRRSEMMAFLEDRRDADVGLAEARRERIDAILTEDQRASLTEMRGRARAFARGRLDARRGRRGGIGLAPRGFRGGRGGFAPDGPGIPGRMRRSRDVRSDEGAATG